MRVPWWRWFLLAALAAALGPAVDECAMAKDIVPCGLFVALSSLTVAAGIAVIAAADIRWGCPAVPFQMNCLAGVLFALTLVDAKVSAAAQEFGGLVAVLADFFQLPLAFITMNLRGWPMAVLGVAFVACVPTSSFDSTVLGTVLAAGTLVAAAFTRHVLDQRAVFFVASLMGQMPMVIPRLREGNPASLIMVLVIMLPFVVCLDTRTVLPDALKQTKFIKLSYLRGMRRSGARIRRLQDMPHAAFGDPAKARYLLITSHRWLDRHMCDVPDAVHPEGLRLASMMRRIGAAFPETIPEAMAGSQSWWHVCKALLRSLFSSGDDVLVFFDFMGLPQIGKDSNGDEIPRTAEEEALFFSALPAMGSLYEMHPVVVIPEVNAETSSYFGSGWCYSEFCTAFLSRTLSTVSAGAEQAYETWQATAQTEGSSLTPALLREATAGPMSGELAEEVLRSLLGDLQHKRFFNDDDRAIVRGIVVANMKKRQLLDAVVAQDVSAVRGHLRHMDREDALDALNWPIDPFNYDCLLHKAVRLHSEDIVRLLLEYGADPRVKNYWGDLPWQYFRLPRWGAGARLCRQWVPPRHTYDAVNTVMI